MPENILETLAKSAREIVEQRKKEVSLEELKAKVKPVEKPYYFEQKLLEPDLSFICELKKASPSKGLINEDFDYLSILKSYEKAGATAISCLTEPTKFLGSLEILNEVTEHTFLPVLRKDFIVDPYQIYEALENGASAVLLICALLSKEDLKELFELAEAYGLSSLVEIHNQEDLNKALEAGVRIIGINNRNLKNFQVDLNTTKELIPYIPKEKIIVSESGIHSREDVKFLEDLGINAVLIGEQLMRSDDPVAELRSLKQDET